VFSGDDETWCTVDGVAKDFNLMVRRGVARPTLAVHRLVEGEALVRDSHAATVLHVLEGGLVATTAGAALLATHASRERGRRRRTVPVPARWCLSRRSDRTFDHAFRPSRFWRWHRPGPFL
jgi:hypothetical protein